MDNLSENSHKDKSEYLSIAEFATAIGKTERQVYRYINQGRIKTINSDEAAGRGKYRVLIARSELDNFWISAKSDSGTYPKLRNSRTRKEEEEEPESEPEDDFFPYDEDEPKQEDYVKPDVIDFTKEDAGEQTTDSAYVTLERHEAAVMRMGYLQGRLEQVQRLLTDGHEKELAKDRQLKTLQEDLHKAQTEIVRLEAKMEFADESKKEKERQVSSLEEELRVAREEIQRLQLPWWKRLFS
ncbi:hypothetical protein IJT10_03595 [bacterium]|nr:hypothetical protein [bacterium]